MKKQLIFIFGILICMTAFGQTPRIKFTYDNAGNQIRRVVTATFNSKAVQDSIPKLEEIITENDYIADASIKNIKYFPNPVKVELYLKWENTVDKVIMSMQVYNINGQLVRNLTALINTSDEIINFENLPHGIYSLLINYTSGENDIIKIIKN